jgi:acyl carrier protein
MLDDTELNVEGAVLEIWCEILGISEFDREQTFFELGGDSLRAISFATRVRERLGVPAPMEVLLFDGRLASVASECAARHAIANAPTLKGAQE